MNKILNGIFTGYWWPIEGMHFLLRKVANLLPMAHANLSVHDLIFKGLENTYRHLIVTFSVTIFWITFLNVVLIILFKLKYNY